MGVGKSPEDGGGVRLTNVAPIDEAKQIHNADHWGDCKVDLGHQSSLLGWCELNSGDKLLPSGGKSGFLSMTSRLIVAFATGIKPWETHSFSTDAASRFNLISRIKSVENGTTG